MAKKNKEPDQLPAPWVELRKSCWIFRRIRKNPDEPIATDERLNYRMERVGEGDDAEFVWRNDGVEGLSSFIVGYVDNLEAPTRFKRMDGLKVSIGDFAALYTCYYNNPNGTSDPYKKIRRVRSFQLLPDIDIMRFIDDNGGAIDINLITGVKQTNP